MVNYRCIVCSIAVSSPEDRLERGVKLLRICHFCAALPCTKCRMSFGKHFRGKCLFGFTRFSFRTAARGETEVPKW